MSSENLEKRSNGSEIVKLLPVSTEEQLLKIGAKRDIYGRMVYKNSALDIKVYWNNLLNWDLEATNLYVLSHQDIEESTCH
jgi:hypothetical protein|tara:strand:- start:110 stop:352 length:243 start_codon:yes stop_codon:yes gene_type:complete